MNPVAAVLVLAFSAVFAGETDKSRPVVLDSHKAPAASLSRSKQGPSERRKMLEEMWQRGILAADTDNWAPGDKAVLERIRRAEKTGAFDVLRRKYHTLRGFVSILTLPDGETTVTRLTREGYSRYLFLISQDAIRYFQEREVAAKWVYKLRDLKGRLLFNGGTGLLTEAGQRVYRRARLNLPVHWVTPKHAIMGNRKPPKHLPPEYYEGIKKK